ncbi:hypothetical protein LMG7974_00395 [Campylobacter majalis]|uniref:Lipoprotein n=1 Tax=Campylobacter majalis TaxID=2790656 RepID=A0ABM8Q3Q8_9BACT|nr:FixH family protein [Campylobacter majalis]CAD7287516.1 hypothetical protein LMG7974_00395 [Campylobacter majalis]
MSKNSKKTFWPYGIVLSIIACVIACVATIIISLDYPVEMDNIYFQNKQKVDQNINEILASQKEFDDKFGIKLLNDEIKINALNEIKISIKNKTQNSKITSYKAMMTRPETNAFNVELNATLTDGFLTTKFNPSLIGRWQFMLQLQDENATGYYRFELFANE